MSIEEFAKILKERAPTADDFVGLATHIGCKFRIKEGKPVVFVPHDDPLGLKIIEIIRREPFRSRVLAAIEHADETVNTIKVETPEQVAPLPHRCKRCYGMIYDTAAAGAICDNVLSCPYRPRGEQS